MSSIEVIRVSEMMLTSLQWDVKKNKRSPHRGGTPTAPFGFGVRYEYLQGSNLLHKLTKPNGMTPTQSYETQRDLLIGMAYHLGSTLVAQREYTYDVLRHPTARTTSRQGNVVNDTFVHNTRSELASAQVNGETYGYDYDNVGNRTAALEESSGVASRTEYSTNALNQYTAITGSENEEEFSFTPTFDADGNQTLIKTETGIWAAVYNAENRPVSFTNNESNTVVECAYDTMGRRSFKKVTVNGTVTLHQRYLYRGYLQIACCDLTRTAHPCLWLITWDPMHTIATRPLAIQKDGAWYTYGLDLTKNVCEVFGTTGYIATTYTYSPYGSVTATGTVTQPIRWSSEVWDNELGMVYYNWRYYNPLSGRWFQRDFLNETNFGNFLYTYASNNMFKFDVLGLLVLLQCARYKWVFTPDPSYPDITENQVRYTSECYMIEIPIEQEDCTKCHSEIRALDKAKDETSFWTRFHKAWDCLNNKAKGEISHNITGPMYANTGSHHVNAKLQDRTKRYNIVAPGVYRLKEGLYKFTNKLVAGITGLNLSVAGKPCSTRSCVWIHGSYGNVYIAPTKDKPAGAQETQGCFAFINGQDRLIYNSMKDHEGRGGMYMHIVDIGNAPVEWILKFRKTAAFYSNPNNRSKIAPDLPMAYTTQYINI